MLGKDEVVAVIPVREGSQRIQNKNFRPFGGAPTLVHHKVAQLKAAIKQVAGNNRYRARH